MGMCKTLGVTPDYVLNMTYENFLMYGYATPTYDTDEDENKNWDASKDANNPDNFEVNGEEEFVKSF